MSYKFVKITHFTMKLWEHCAVRTQDITHQLANDGSDFIKTNHQFHVKTIIKLHNIFIKLKLGTLCGVLSFYISSVFRLFAKGKTFVYMSPCSQKFDNSRTSSIYFSGIDKNTIHYTRQKVHGSG